MVTDLVALHKLARAAWSDTASMQVLMDRLLELGAIEGFPEFEHERRVSWYGTDHSAKDDALYRLESAAREWIINLHSSDLELRVTGPWPDIVYVVYRNDGPKGETTLSERVEFLSVVKQPRLLRAP